MSMNGIKSYRLLGDSICTYMMMLYWVFECEDDVLLWYVKWRDYT